MSRISISLEESIKKQIEELASKEETPVAKYIVGLIQLGLKIKTMQQDETRKKEQELQEKMPEYLLTLIGLCSETLRCTYDPEKIRNKSKNAEDSIAIIKEKVTAYIDGFTGRDSE